MKKHFLAISFFLCNSAHAVVFEAYKESLENALLCKSLPLEIDMHKQLLLETGAIHGKAKKDKIGFKYYNINNGFSVFDLGLLRITLDNDYMIANVKANIKDVYLLLQQHGVNISTLNGIYSSTVIPINNVYGISIFDKGESTDIGCIVMGDDTD